MQFCDGDEICVDDADEDNGDDDDGDDGDDDDDGGDGGDDGGDDGDDDGGDGEGDGDDNGGDDDDDDDDHGDEDKDRGEAGNEKCCYSAETHRRRTGGACICMYQEETKKRQNTHSTHAHQQKGCGRGFDQTPSVCTYPIIRVPPLVAMIRCTRRLVTAVYTHQRPPLAGVSLPTSLADFTCRLHLLTLLAAPSLAHEKISKWAHTRENFFFISNIIQVLSS